MMLAVGASSNTDVCQFHINELSSDYLKGNNELTYGDRSRGRKYILDALNHAEDASVYCEGKKIRDSVNRMKAALRDVLKTFPKKP